MDKESAVDCFFFYMWNAWSRKECDALFAERSDEIYRAWERDLEDFGSIGAPSWFYEGLKRADRRVIADRAVEYYNE